MHEPDTYDDLGMHDDIKSFKYCSECDEPVPHNDPVCPRCCGREFD